MPGSSSLVNYLKICFFYKKNQQTTKDPEEKYQACKEFRLFLKIPYEYNQMNCHLKISFSQNGFQMVCIIVMFPGAIKQQ